MTKDALNGRERNIEKTKTETDFSWFGVIFEIVFVSRFCYLNRFDGIGFASSKGLDQIICIFDW